MNLERIRNSNLHQKVMSADEASQFIKDGMTVGMSGFTRGLAVDLGRHNINANVVVVGSMHHDVRSNLQIIFK